MAYDIQADVLDAQMILSGFQFYEAFRMTVTLLVVFGKGVCGIPFRVFKAPCSGQELYS